MWVSIVIAVIIILIVGEWLYYNLTKPLPGPWGVPLLYSLPEVAASTRAGTTLETFEGWRLKYGPTLQARIPGVGKGPYVFSCKPEDVEHVLVTAFDNYPKVDFINEILGPLLGRGIFAVNGHEWLTQRKAAANAFRVTDIKHSIKVFQRVARDLVTVFEAENGRDVDMQNLFASATLSGFCEAALSMHLVDVSTAEGEFAFHFNRVQRCLQARLGQPLYALLWWTESERQLKESVAYLDHVAYSAIKTARAREPDHPADLLTPFLEMDGVTDVYLRDVLMNLLIAGRDTTSQTLAWSVYFLSRHPLVQEKLFAEVTAFLPDENAEPEWKIQTDGKLPYLTAVIKETLRMRPPVPSDPKAALKDDVLPSGAVIRAGSTFDWYQWGLSRDPTLFEDPLAFKPERWSEPPQDSNILSPPSTNRPPWIPFQHGPRVCLGKRMAENDMEVVLIMLVRKFRFLPSSVEPKIIQSITLAAKDGIMVIPQRR